MVRALLASMLLAFFASACNTMDGLVTDVDHGVSKLKGEEPSR